MKVIEEMEPVLEPIPVQAMVAGDKKSASRATVTLET